MNLPVPIASVQRREALLPSQREWATQLEMAGILFKSGMLPSHIKGPEACMAIIQKGLELGLPPMYALSNIAFIQGRPTANAEAMAALIYRDHGDDALRFEEATDEAATVSYKRRGWSERRTARFTMQDAERAGLPTKNAVWKQYPGSMLRARVISVAARTAFQDTIGGLYIPEELGAPVEVTEDGEVVVRVQDTDYLAPNKPVEPRQLAAQPAAAAPVEAFDPTTVAFRIQQTITEKLVDDNWALEAAPAKQAELRDRLTAAAGDEGELLYRYLVGVRSASTERATRAEAGAVLGFLKSQNGHQAERVAMLLPLARAWEAAAPAVAQASPRAAAPAAAAPASDDELF